MESLSTAELLEIAALSRSSYDAQFQYWVGITFAILVARFSFAEKFQKDQLLLVAFIYAATSFLFFARYGVELTVAGIYRDAAIERGAVWYDGDLGLLFWIRLSVWVVGTFVTLYMLLRTDKKRR